MEIGKKRGIEEVEGEEDEEGGSGAVGVGDDRWLKRRKRRDGDKEVEVGSAGGKIAASRLATYGITASGEKLPAVGSGGKQIDLEKDGKRRKRRRKHKKKAREE